MQGETVSAEPLVRSHPFLLPCRIMYLKTEIQSKQEEVEVKSYSGSPVGSYAFSEGIPFEECSGILRAWIFLESPDVSCIYEKGAGHFPEHLESVLYVGFKPHVTGLIRDDEGCIPLGCARTYSPGLPASEAACSTGIEMLLERQCM